MAWTIRSMIRVLDESRSVAFYEKAFGLNVAERLEFPEFALIQLSNQESEFELELTVNKGQTEPYNPGDGYGHIAVSSDNLDVEHERFMSQGLNPRNLVEFPPAGEVISHFFFCRCPGWIPN